LVINRVILQNFRNYGEQAIEFNRRFNFIFGNNGNGKTNILEAVSFLSQGRSFIGAIDHECVKFGCDNFVLDGKFENDLGNFFNVKLNYSSVSKKKSYNLNNEKISGFSNDIFGRFPVVHLSPHSLNITYGNPSERRKFFDILISQTNKVYLELLKDLSKIIKCKNALLKINLANGKYNDKQFNDMLDSYNEKLIINSADIINRRINFLKSFVKYCRTNFRELIAESENVFINYFSDTLQEISPEKETPAVQFILDSVKSDLEKNRHLEIARGITLIGPHRDDYFFKLSKNGDTGGEGFSLKSFGSQGEHKTFIIGLKLAEFYYIKDNSGTSPVLMLDDVLSELDRTRISKIISHLNSYGQIILTTTDKNYLKEIKGFYDKKDISVLNVKDGSI
jgi:DNA replication and repair protein RecF